MTDVMGCKHAVILSGGGASGAYEVGVLKALFDGKSPVTSYSPLVPDIFAGTSIGAYNASVLVAELSTRGIAAIDYLQDIWLNVLPRDDNTGHNSAFRVLADPIDFLDPRYALRHPIEDTIQLAGDLAYVARDFYRRGVTFLLSSGDLETRTLRLVDISTLISNEPEYKLIRQTINFDRIRRSDTVLRIATTNWSTGGLRVFQNAEMTDDLGPKAVLASTSLPGIFAQIEIQGEYYADGGVVMNTPLKLGIEAGAEILHCIYLDPDVKAIPLLPVRNTLDTFTRFMAVQFAATMDRDIETARRVNRGIEVLERAAAGAPLSSEDTQPFILAAQRLSRITDPSKYKKLVIHLYRPRDTLSGILGLLNFDAEKSFDLIQQGFRDAIHHDCKASQCVLLN